MGRPATRLPIAWANHGTALLCQTGLSEVVARQYTARVLLAIAELDGGETVYIPELETVKTWAKKKAAHCE